MKLYFNIGLNTFYQVAARAITAVVGLITTRLITDSLGVTGYGQYAIVLTYVTLFWILTDFGLNAIAVREMASDEEHLSQNFSALITLRGLLGIFLTLFSALLLIFLPYSAVVKQAILLTSLTIFFQSIMGSANGLFQVKLRYDRQLISNALSSTASLLLVLWAVNQGLGLLAFVGAFTVGSFIMAVVNIYLAHKWIPFKLTTDTSRLKNLFKETLPFGTALLFSLATFKIDTLMMSVLPLQALSNEVAVGVYALGYRVFELILIIPVFFMNPVYPVLVRHLKESFGKFKMSVQKALVTLISASVVVIAGIYFLAPWIVSLIAEGEEFADSVTVLRVLASWAPLFFTTALLMWVLVTLKKQKELIIVYVSGFVFNFSVNYIFIPQYHYWAAAVTTGATELLILVLLGYFVIKEMKNFSLLPNQNS